MIYSIASAVDRLVGQHRRVKQQGLLELASRAYPFRTATACFVKQLLPHNCCLSVLDLQSRKLISDTERIAGTNSQDCSAPLLTRGQPNRKYRAATATTCLPDVSWSMWFFFAVCNHTRRPAHSIGTPHASTPQLLRTLRLYRPLAYNTACSYLHAVQLITSYNPSVFFLTRLVECLRVILRETPRDLQQPLAASRHAHSSSALNPTAHSSSAKTVTSRL